MFLKGLFKKPLEVKTELPFAANDYGAEVGLNRRTLALVDNWIDEDAFSKSFYQYGVPDFIKSEINKTIDESLTYTDILLFLAKKYLSDIHYLEIGVSVGKNFYQILNGIENGSFFGFDIEEISPVIARKFNFKNRIEWHSPDQSIKKNKSSLSKYEFQGKEINYVSGDVWDENSWKALIGQKFNIVFSDALHTPEAILSEFKTLIKYKLLDKKFIIVWDDLVGDMQGSFFEIVKKYNKTCDIKEVYLLNINGWVGQYEGPHTVGIISNFRFM